MQKRAVNLSVRIDYAMKCIITLVVLVVIAYTWRDVLRSGKKGMLGHV